MKPKNLNVFETFSMCNCHFYNAKSWLSGWFLEAFNLMYKYSKLTSQKYVFFFSNIDVGPHEQKKPGKKWYYCKMEVMSLAHQRCK